MPFWTLFGLHKGKATTAWPREGGEDGQQGLLGMPRFEPARCENGCRECAEICPTQAIKVEAEQTGETRLEVDYGRCVVCQLCVEACPTGAAASSFDWAFGTRERAELLLSSGDRPIATKAAQPESRQGFRRSLHIRHVDAGSCNGCESELQALNNPY
jgi:formate hydrogenlyase subunit 6/NADH:ubiquinone oxidoreductase subunit I